MLYKLFSFKAGAEELPPLDGQYLEWKVSRLLSREVVFGLESNLSHFEKAKHSDRSDVCFDRLSPHAAEHEAIESECDSGTRSSDTQTTISRGKRRD